MYDKPEKRGAPVTSTTAGLINPYAKGGDDDGINPELAFLLADQDARIASVKDDVGRFAGHGASSMDFSNGGAGAVPMTQTDAAQKLSDAGIPATHTESAVGGDGPAHLSQLNPPAVHAKLTAGGYEHVASTEDAQEDPQDDPNAADTDVEGEDGASSNSQGYPIGGSRRGLKTLRSMQGGVACNVYDQKYRGTTKTAGTHTDRFVTHHHKAAGGKGGTAIRGYTVGGAGATNPNDPDGDGDNDAGGAGAGGAA